MFQQIYDSKAFWTCPQNCQCCILFAMVFVRPPPTHFDTFIFYFRRARTWELKRVFSLYHPILWFRHVFFLFGNGITFCPTTKWIKWKEHAELYPKGTERAGVYSNVPPIWSSCVQFSQSFLWIPLLSTCCLRKKKKLFIFTRNPPTILDLFLNYSIDNHTIFQNKCKKRELASEGETRAPWLRWKIRIKRRGSSFQSILCSSRLNQNIDVYTERDSFLLFCRPYKSTIVHRATFFIVYTSLPAVWLSCRLDDTLKEHLKVERQHKNMTM